MCSFATKLINLQLSSLSKNLLRHLNKKRMIKNTKKDLKKESQELITIERNLKSYNIS